MQEHAAWLEEPQEMATFDHNKTEPLLESSAKGGADAKPMKGGKQEPAAGKASGDNITDSVIQRKVAEKLSQV